MSIMRGADNTPDYLVLIKRYNSRLMMLNLLTLMVIAFIPFPSSLISKYPGQTATMFYALTKIPAAPRRTSYLVVS